MADDYVVEFTRDVPRVKLITAGDIAVAPGVGPEPRQSVSADTTLEQLMPRFSESMSAIAVTGEGGAVVGHVSPLEVLTTLASESEDTP